MTSRSAAGRSTPVGTAALPCTPQAAQDNAWKAAVRPGALLRDVEARLVSAGALTELRQLQGLSASEVDVLLWLEVHEPILSVEFPIMEIPIKDRYDLGRGPVSKRSRVSGSPHGTSGTVAA